MARDATLFYVHDPMCSWCWGFRPTFDQFVERLPEDIGLVRLLGGLAPDTDQPMPDTLRRQLQSTWHRIQDRIPGTRFNFDFWADCEPRRSTWPACRAVIAARQCAPEKEQDMIRAIQHAYYLDARNPSNPETLIELAGEIGLNTAEFRRALLSRDTASTLAREIATARAMGIDSFPSLRLSADGTIWAIPVDYLDPSNMLDAVTRVRRDAP